MIYNQIVTWRAFAILAMFTFLPTTAKEQTLPSILQPQRYFGRISDIAFAICTRKESEQPSNDTLDIHQFGGKDLIFTNLGERNFVSPKFHLLACFDLLKPHQCRTGVIFVFQILYHSGILYLDVMGAYLISYVWLLVYTSILICLVTSPNKKHSIFLKQTQNIGKNIHINNDIDSQISKS